MLKLLRGIHSGTRTGRVSAALCRDIINHLLQAQGYVLGGILIDAENSRLSIRDTAHILKECYHLCFFKAMSPKAGPEWLGAAAVQAQDTLQEWLIKVFQEVDPNYEYVAGVKDTFSNIDHEYVEWANELRSGHPELHNFPKDQWLPAAISHFMIRVSSYLKNRGIAPQDLEALLYASVESNLL